MSATVNSSSGATSVRYHGMDALRAWAMSMGIVLHAAWIMVPGDFGAPMTDASASSLAEYVLLGIHMFRMQLFFVLAGLFACLLYRKRGMASFTKNRVKRIVVPLVVFWILLVPIMICQRFAAGLHTGAIQAPSSAWELTWQYLLSVRPGNILLMHLWFLYYLCWAYVVLFVARALIISVDPNGTFRNRVSDAFGSLISKPWSVVGLGLFFGALMFPMLGCIGVEVEYLSLYSWRKLPGLVTYVLYFTAGWLIYRNIDKLGLMIRGWRWQLALGFLLTVPYYFYAQYAMENGYSTINYPQLTLMDFHYDEGAPEYSQMRERMLSAEAGTVPAELWSLLPEENQEFIRAHESATENQLNGLLVTINRRILGLPDLAEQTDPSTFELPGEVSSLAGIAADDRSVVENCLLNRALIDQGFSGIIYSENIHRPYYYPLRAAHCFYYSLTTWLLIFGCIGFSQHHFDRESRFWRYFSDSSYWFYLAHLPIQFQLLLWVGDKPWHPAVKFTFYVVATIGVLLPTYHFLVRPTWIGLLLNGRMTSVWKKKSDAPAPTPLKEPSDSSQRIDEGTTGPQSPSDPDDSRIEDAVVSS